MSRVLIFLFFLGYLVLPGHGQGIDSEVRVVQLSGIILGEDSTNAIPGVHVYVPRYGRGTTSNGY